MGSGGRDRSAKVIANALSAGGAGVPVGQRERLDDSATTWPNTFTLSRLESRSSAQSSAASGLSTHRRGNEVGLQDDRGCPCVDCTGVVNSVETAAVFGSVSRPAMPHSRGLLNRRLLG